MDAPDKLDEITVEELDRVEGGALDPSAQRLNNAMGSFIELATTDPNKFLRLTNHKRRGQPF